MSSVFVENLDAFLAVSGTDIVLRRVVGTGASAVPYDVTVRASVRTVNQPDQLSAGLSQDDIRAVISMTQIIAANWPGVGDQGSGVHFVDRRIPRKGDKIIYGGRMYRAEFVNTIKINDEVVRVEITTKGGAAA